MLTRCLFCDRPSKASAPHFLGTHERLKEHIADVIRYTMAIVFHSNADGSIIVPKCNLNPRLRAELPRRCLVIHSRTYPAQFIRVMPSASHRTKKLVPS